MNEASLKRAALAWHGAGRDAAIIEVRSARGSAPRGAGTRMVVCATEQLGTIGGGHLEWEAVRMAQRWLASSQREAQVARFALGPTLGQCCGGVVDLEISALDAAALDRWTLNAPRFRLFLYGAGHVGAAIVRILEDVDCEVDWIDVRETAFEREPASHIRCIVSEGPTAEAVASPPGAHHLVMTHSHALDFDLVEALLRRPDTGWVGLIGSATKRARFEHRLAARGIPWARIAQLSCPVGLPGISGKEPAVIAVAVVGQLLSLPTSSLTDDCGIQPTLSRSAACGEPLFSRPGGCGS